MAICAEQGPGCPGAESWSPGLGARSQLCKPGQGAGLSVQAHKMGRAVPSTQESGAQMEVLLMLLPEVWLWGNAQMKVIILWNLWSLRADGK